MLAALEALPSVLSVPLHEYASEAASPVLRLHRLCDAVEILTRFCAIVAIGEVRGLNAGKLPEAVLAELQPRIELPTFPKWRGMLDALLIHLPRTAPLVVGELPDFVRGHLLPALLGGDDQQPEKCLLSLRNLLAHGGAMTRAAAQEFLRGWEPWLERLVPLLSFFGDCVVCHHGEEQTRRLRGPRGRRGRWSCRWHCEWQCVHWRGTCYWCAKNAGWTCGRFATTARRG